MKFFMKEYQSTLNIYIYKCRLSNRRITESFNEHVRESTFLKDIRRRELHISTKHAERKLHFFR